jgi:hypothetical protein
VARFKERTVFENFNNKIVGSNPSRHIYFRILSVLVLSCMGCEMGRSHIEEVTSNM